MAPAVDSEMSASPSKKEWWEEKCLGISGKDKKGNIPSHNDALVITLQIIGFNVRRAMIDQGSRAKVMYLDLYEGLALMHKDLTWYYTLLVAFDGTMVTPII